MLAWWRHQMETFSASLAFVRGIHRSPVNSPHKGQWRGTLMFSLICAWTNGWVNNLEAGDWRRHRAHYDATVMERGPHVSWDVKLVAQTNEEMCQGRLPWRGQQWGICGQIIKYKWVGLGVTRAQICVGVRRGFDESLWQWSKHEPYGFPGDHQPDATML